MRLEKKKILAVGCESPAGTEILRLLLAEGAAVEAVVRNEAAAEGLRATAVRPQKAASSRTGFSDGALLPGTEGESTKAAAAGSPSFIDDKEQPDNNTGSFHVTAANITAPAEMEQAVHAAVERLGGLDVLVNAVDEAETPCLAEDMAEGDWLRVMEAELNSVFLAAHFALPALRESKGCVITVSSAGGLGSVRQKAARSAAKSGLLGFTRALACDYGKYGVRAAAVCPGEDGLPLGGEEVARTVVFLASEEASYVSGIAIPVDCGAGALRL